MLHKLFVLALVCFSAVKSDVDRMANSISKDGLTVNTLNGDVRGVRFDYDSKYQETSNPQNVSYSVRAWLGIPYAQPPVGDLRFKRPLPVQNWTNVLNATKFQSRCFQTDTTDPMSEDCLFLDIWAPDEANNSAVLVYD